MSGNLLLQVISHLPPFHFHHFFLFASKDHQKQHWSLHKKICLPRTPTTPSSHPIITSAPLEIMTPEGYPLHLCQIHHNEICSLCQCNYSMRNAYQRYSAILKHSNKVLEEENKLSSQLKQCSNPNCQSRWEATEDFIPPVIPLEQLSPCLSCHHAVYCSRSCQREHHSEHQMICKLFTSMFRDGPAVLMSFRPGTILEETFEGVPTGLQMKIIFFNGDVDPMSSLDSAPYYILEYLPHDPLPLISSGIIFETPPSTMTTESTLWKRHASQSILERYVSLQPTDTFVHILQSNDSNGESLHVVEPWVKGRHVIPSEGEIEGGRKRFVVVPCRIVHEGKKWRVVG